MSYCRFSDADVYMYWHVGGFVECCCCSLAELVEGSTAFMDEMSGKSKESDYKGPVTFSMHGNTKCDTFSEAIEHLKKHKEKGDRVPDYAFEGLERDRDEFNDTPKASFCDVCGGANPMAIDLKTGSRTCVECLDKNA